MSVVTWAIRYKQTEEEKKAGKTPAYITYDEEQFPQTGYGYCCPCKETKQFPNRKAAENAITAMKLCPKRHEAIDSETAAKEKRARKKQ